MPGETEVSQLELDVDKELLREAMMLVGRARMRQAGSEQAQKQLQNLEEFIKAKKVAVIERTANLKKEASESSKPGETEDREGLLEKLTETQVEFQLLLSQSPMYQKKLNEAINELATAEFEASNDGTQQEKADSERKQFSTFKAK